MSQPKQLQNKPEDKPEQEEWDVDERVTQLVGNKTDFQSGHKANKIKSIISNPSKLIKDKGNVRPEDIKSFINSSCKKEKEEESTPKGFGIKPISFQTAVRRINK